MPVKPRRPRPPDVRREHEVIPQGDELLDVDEPADVVSVAFPKHLFVHPNPVPAIGEVIELRWSAPPNVQRELDNSGGLLDSGISKVLRHGDRARIRAQATAPRRRHRDQSLRTLLLAGATHLVVEASTRLLLLGRRRFGDLQERVVEDAAEEVGGLTVGLGEEV